MDVAVRQRAGAVILPDQRIAVVQEPRVHRAFDDLPSRTGRLKPEPESSGQPPFANLLTTVRAHRRTSWSKLNWMPLLWVINHVSSCVPSLVVITVVITVTVY